METDVNEFAKFCPTCQVSQQSKEGREQETRFYQVQKIQPFKAWGINIIGELLKML